MKKSFLIVSICIFFVSVVWVAQAYFHTPKLFPFTSWKDTKAQLAYGAITNDVELHYTDRVKNDLIKNKKSFVEANLSEMKVSVYKDGNVVLSLPIKSKGRDGSWWETPTGVYSFKTKEENHFSSLGHVYMPWSMAFQGNFFIHGWPYYPDGTDVSSTYSGGCIRLSTEDAKKVYDLVEVGEPILVTNQNQYADGVKYILANSGISAESYLVGDLRNNFIFSSNKEDKNVPIKGITKLLTAIVSAEYADIETKLQATTEAESTVTSIPRVVAGKSYSIYDLLFPLLEENSNQAATLVGSYPSQKTFVARMKEKADAIGMENASLVEPTGATSENTASASSLFHLAQYLYTNRQFVLRMTAGTAPTHIYGEPLFSGLENKNLFINDKRFVGGIADQEENAKSGLFIFEIPFGASTRPITIILLNSNDLEKDVQTAITQASQFYKLEEAKTET